MKTLEELGIGRPSTYASIIDTIQRREYVTLEEKRFRPTDVGEVVTDKLIEHFPDVVDVQLHGLHGEGARRHRRGRSGQDADAPRVQRAVRARAGEGRATRSSGTRRTWTNRARCAPPRGASRVSFRSSSGRYGKFIGCTNYPECRYIRNMDGSVRPEPKMLDEICPECGKHNLQERVGRFGAVHRLQRLPGLQVHQEGAAALHGRDVPRVQPGRAARAQEPVRPGLLQLQPLPRLHDGREQPAHQGPPVPRVRVAPAAASEEHQVLELRRGAGPGLQRDEVRATSRARPPIRAAKAAAREARAAKKKPAAKKPAAKKKKARRPPPRRRRPPPAPRPRRPSSRRRRKARKSPCRRSPTRSRRCAEPSRPPSKTS